MYYAYYVQREDEDWDLLAIIPDEDEIDERLSRKIQLALTLALIDEELFIDRGSDPNFPSVNTIGHRKKEN